MELFVTHDKDSSCVIYSRP